MHLFGSTANGLALANTNDIDVCLEMAVGGDSQEERAAVVERLGAGLREANMSDILVLPKVSTLTRVGCIQATTVPCQSFIILENGCASNHPEGDSCAYASVYLSLSV